MSGVKEVKKPAAGSAATKKKKWDPIQQVKRVLRRREKERILRKLVNPVAYNKQKRLNMGAHYRDLAIRRARKQYLRVASNPWLVKDQRKLKKRKNTSVFPKVGKLSAKSKQLFLESIPLTSLAKQEGLPRSRVRSPAPLKRLRTTREWLKAERKEQNRQLKKLHAQNLKEKQEKKEALKKKQEEFKKKKEEFVKEGGKKKAEPAKKEEGKKKKKEKTVKTPSVRRKKSRSLNRKVSPLRKSITPGTILITLRPPFLGRRVIFLKQLHSGALLCAGPRKLNRAVLHRINPRHVIATSTKLDISTVKLGKLKERELFKQERKKRSRADAKVFFGEEKKEKKVSNLKPLLAATKAIDKQLWPLVDKVPYLAKYLSTRFSLGRYSYPHLMKF